jgi:hypothetical protein
LKAAQPRLIESRSDSTQYNTDNHPGKAYYFTDVWVKPEVNSGYPLTPLKIEYKYTPQLSKKRSIKVIGYWLFVIRLPVRCTQTGKERPSIFIFQPAVRYNFLL